MPTLAHCESSGTRMLHLSPIASGEIAIPRVSTAGPSGTLPAFVAGMSEQCACSIPPSTVKVALPVPVPPAVAEAAELPQFEGVDQPRMRLIAAGKKPVVEVTTPVPQIRLYEAYRALRGHGVQVVHTAVRRSGNTIVQLLHLAEADGTEFTSRRLRETLATLRRECGLILARPRRRAAEWLDPQGAGGTTWQSYAT